MKAMRHAVAAGLLIGLGACSNLLDSSGGPSHSAMATQPTVAPALVQQVQSRLRDNGYYKQGSVDGVWGTGTESAVRSYQHDHNLSSNGQLDVPTLQALNIAPATTATAPTQPMNAPGPAATAAPPSTTAPADTTTNSSTGTPVSPTAPR